MEKLVPSRARLGGYELNLTTGELRALEKADGAVLLREQPFQILKMLIERGGKIATREEIRKKLWPNDTIVNFDHSINVAIGVLRRAFGDSAENPRYIETLARRGYRLMVTPELLLTKAEQATSKQLAKLTMIGPTEILGKRVSHYRVLEVIGGGGMGMVYRAEDLKLGRSVALKFLPPEVADDPVTLRRFEREAQTASALNHLNICTIHEIEEHEGQPFIVMELLEGRSLNHELDSSASKIISTPRLVEIALQICDGLQAAHEKGIIHRDIKPANIFLTAKGPVKILDFGLAKLIESEEDCELTPDGVGGGPSPDPEPRDPAMGTAGYMSPEQVRKEKLDARTDLFSFGLVLYEMAAGQRAFTGQTAAVVHEGILHAEPAPLRALNPALPSGFNTIIAKALEKERERRYQSAAEMRNAIEKLVQKTRRAQVSVGKCLFAASLIVASALGIWMYWRAYHRVTLSPSDTVVLAVTNQTGDPVFNDAIYISLLYGIEQTPYINVLAVNKVGEALSRLNLVQDPTKITPQVARQVCLRSNSKLVVAASITEAGNNFRIDLDGINCQSGKTIARVQNDAPSRTQVVHVLGMSAMQLRRELGEPDASIARFNKPLEEAASASPEALQLLTEGYRRSLFVKYDEAISNYQRATELDPNLALAYVAMAGAFDGQGNMTAAAAAATKGYNLRARMTEPTRFNAEDVYYLYGTGEQDKRCSVLSQWVQSFPNDHTAHYNFAKCLQFLGQFDQSLAEARESLRLLPSSVSYEAVMLTAVSADRFEEAKSAYNEAAERGFDSISLHDLRFQLAFLQNDTVAMQEQSSWAAGKPGANRRFLRLSAIVKSNSGQYREYRHLSEQAVELASKEGASLDLGFYADDDASREAEVGNLEKARELARRALSLGQSRDTELILALASARAGDVAQAQKIADRIGREAPLDTLVQSFCLPTIRAAIALSRNEPAEAVEILQPAMRYDFADPPVFYNLYPAYLRGLAYLQMGEGSEAAAEFRKLLEHPGLVGMFELGPLSHLQLARALKVAGNEAAARKSYEDFLALWKDADPDLPIYRQAQTEYTNLHTSARNGE